MVSVLEACLPVQFPWEDFPSWGKTGTWVLLWLGLIFRMSPGLTGGHSLRQVQRTTLRGWGAMLTPPLPPPLSTSLNSALQQNHPFWPLEDFWEKTAWQCTPLTDEDTEVWRC